MSTFQSHHGTFLRADPSNYVNLAPHCKEWEHWHIENHFDGRVSLRSHHGTHLRADPNCSVNLTTNCQDWEKWYLENNGDGTVSFRSHHGTYLRADPNGSVNLAPHKKEWEKWRTNGGGFGGGGLPPTNVTVTFGMGGMGGMQSPNMGMGMGMQSPNMGMGMNMGGTVGYQPPNMGMGMGMGMGMQSPNMGGGMNMGMGGGMNMGMGGGFGGSGFPPSTSVTVGFQPSSMGGFGGFGGLPQGNFHLVSEANPSMALDVQGANFSQGAQLIVWPLEMRKINQTFRFNPNGSISCVGAPHLVVDVRGGANQGADIILWQDHNGDNQKWTVHPDNSIRLQNGSNLALDIQGGNANSGTKVIAWPHHGQANQRWRIVNC